MKYKNIVLALSMCGMFSIAIPVNAFEPRDAVYGHARITKDGVKLSTILSDGSEIVMSENAIEEITQGNAKR
ncbi:MULTISPECIES: hypothetical protein [Deefgea]|uniref:Uncharacterized protein n=1 Tax=Deefgea chitinilytica TaxID=570276 RepID=A0ABS2CAD0_9NEIS|nr:MULTISPECIES: hypothetical protein [Deefgea]MBM5571106.1 hypothetical protein [Deefgea chitinilytica]MBM9888336.1 hypothetical protein [Deefgea sp. CFH1-16]